MADVFARWDTAPWAWLGTRAAPMRFQRHFGRRLSAEEPRRAQPPA